MKKLLLCMLLIGLAFNMNAQEQGKIRVGFDGGVCLPNNGAGLNGDLDFRYNIKDNINVGVKLNGGALFKDIFVDEYNSTASLTTSLISSTLVTSDYYFSTGKSIFASFLGGGLGFYKIYNMGMSVSGTTAPSPTTNTTNILPENRFGGLLRGGFELGHFRMALEYYLIPQTYIYDLNTLAYSRVKTGNSFVNLSLGFYFGGGHWRK